MHLEADLSVTTAQCSIAGKKPENDDSLGLFVPSDPALLTMKGLAAVVADGVSAAESGREAAELCVRGFLDDYFATPEAWSVATSAQKVISSLNRWLFSQGRRYADAQRGYVCTLSVLVLKSRTLHVFHVGDSRIYRVRGGVIEQLTTDHKLQINQGTAYLARAVGLDVKLDVDHRSLPAEVGDLYLMTTDGVHDHVTSEELAQSFADSSRSLEASCERLIALALEHGSADNLTCQALRVDALPSPKADEVYSALSALPFPPPLQVGSVLDGYRVLRELYASPRSQLYAVEDTLTGEKLAMKTPSVKFDDDPAYIERFVMEPWIGSRVDSPHVIRSKSSERRQTFLYHLQEVVEGVTLLDWQKEHRDPDIREVVRIIGQIARGLAALHRRETIHRDLKPDNIMLDADGQVKIVDFGSCFVAGVDEIATVIARDAVLGTATYSAPELLAGEAPTPRADQFSLGVIAYELLTGKLPYGPSVDNARSRADYNRLTYTPAYHLNPLIPVWMDGALKKAVRPDPTTRYDEISELVHDLSYPNPHLTGAAALPVVQRDPVLFWRTVAALLLALELATVYYFVTARAPQNAGQAVPADEAKPGPRRRPATGRVR